MGEICKLFKERPAYPVLINAQVGYIQYIIYIIIMLYDYYTILLLYYIVIILYYIVLYYTINRVRKRSFCRNSKQVSTLSKSSPLSALLDSFHLSLCQCCTGHERASFALHAQRVACAICRVHITHTQRGRHMTRSGLAGTVCGMQIAILPLSVFYIYVCVCVCESFLLFLLWLCNCMANKLPHTSVSSVSHGTWKAHDKSGIFCMGHSYSARHSSEKGSGGGGMGQQRPQNY